MKKKKKRKGKVKRVTKETNISVNVNLDGVGLSSILTGIGFFDHMLELFSKHSLIDIKLKVKGDLQVDEHHIVEDVGIVLGEAIGNALGEKKGIERYGFVLPMDESLAMVALDLGGRSALVWNVVFSREKLGGFPTELFQDFFISLSNSLPANLHVAVPYGRNEHHKAEAIFKALARAMKFAITRDKRIQELVPSTKGVL